MATRAIRQDFSSDFEIDADGSLHYSATTGTLVTGVAHVIGIFWIADQVGGEDIATDDNFLLSDTDGYRIIGKMASFIGDDLGVVIPPPGLKVDGVVITTMDGGVCYVWTT